MAFKAEGDLRPGGRMGNKVLLLQLGGGCVYGVDNAERT